MEIGFTWHHGDPEEWKRAIDLRPSWTKFALAFEGWEQERAQTQRWCELLLTMGCEPVIDLRTGEFGSFAASAPADTWEWRRTHWGNDHLFDGFATWAGEVARDLRGLCENFEVWGEAPCLWVGQSFWNGENYLRMLQATSAAVREAQPAALVWFGGHGVNGGVSFWKDVEERGGGSAYDVQNLHCFMHSREWSDVELHLRHMFGEIERAEAASGHAHTLALTEFGWPTARDGEAEYTSQVENAVRGLDEDDAAEWMDASLRVLEECGVAVVNVLMLRDGEGDHWGSHLGLYRRDWSEKPMLEVVREWIERGRE